MQRRSRGLLISPVERRPLTCAVAMIGVAAMNSVMLYGAIQQRFCRALVEELTPPSLLKMLLQSEKRKSLWVGLSVVSLIIATLGLVPVLSLLACYRLLSSLWSTDSCKKAVPLRLGTFRKASRTTQMEIEELARSRRELIELSSDMLEHHVEWPDLPSRHLQRLTQENRSIQKKLLPGES